MYVLLYDHLFGTGIRGGGALKRLVMDNKVRRDVLVLCVLHSSFGPLVQ